MIDYTSVTDIHTNFLEAAEKIQFLNVKPTNDELLLLYGLFKQSKFGNNTTIEPFILNIKSKAKWNAWTLQKDKSKIKSQEEYIFLVENLSQKYAQ